MSTPLKDKELTIADLLGTHNGRNNTTGNDKRDHYVSHHSVFT